MSMLDPGLRLKTDLTGEKGFQRERNIRSGKEETCRDRKKERKKERRRRNLREREREFQKNKCVR